jgi:hypothetical protein
LGRSAGWIRPPDIDSEALTDRRVIGRGRIGF